MTMVAFDSRTLLQKQKHPTRGAFAFGNVLGNRTHFHPGVRWTPGPRWLDTVGTLRFAAQSGNRFPYPAPESPRWGAGKLRDNSE